MIAALFRSRENICRWLDAVKRQQRSDGPGSALLPILLDEGRNATVAAVVTRAAEVGMERLTAHRIVRLLGKGDTRVRATVASAMGGMQEPSFAVLVGLNSALRDPNDEVRLLAAKSLGDIGEPASLALRELEALAKRSAEPIAQAARSSSESIRTALKEYRKTPREEP